MSIRFLRMLTALTLALCLILAAIFGLDREKMTGGLELRPVPTWRPIHSEVKGTAKNLAAPVIIAEALSRPLFRVTRRPYAPPALPLQATVSEMATIIPPPPASVDPPTILGVLLQPGNRKVLVRTADLPDGQWFAEGSEISGWRIEALDAEGATISGNGQRLRLKLYVDKAGSE